MASKYLLKSRVPDSGQVYCFESAAVTVVDSTTTHFICDLPPGAYRITVLIRATGNADNTITTTVLPYATAAQDDTNDVGVALGLIIPGGSSVGAVTTAASAGIVNTFAFVVGSAGSNMSVNLPIALPYGFRVTTVTNAGAGAAAGSYTVTVIAVEG